MWVKFIIQIICYLIMFLFGCYQGWKMGRKRRPCSDKLQTFTNEELSLLDDALLDEIERRTKESMKQRRARGDVLKAEPTDKKESRIESQDTTECCPFEEFEGDKTCKH